MSWVVFAAHFDLLVANAPEYARFDGRATLTYPGDWKCVAPGGASVKRHMRLWRKRFQREWGEPARYIWKLEFQRRGARSGRKFRDWLSQEWADIVAHPDSDQRARHPAHSFRKPGDSWAMGPVAFGGPLALGFSDELADHCRPFR